MVQLFGSKRSSGTRKAMRFLSDRGIDYQFRDLDESGLSPRELDDLLRGRTAEDLIDTGSKEFERRGLAYMDIDIRQELLESPGLFRNPLLRTKRGWTVGVDEASWKAQAEFVKTQG